MVFAHNVLRTRIGRALVAVRDREVAASVIGVDVGRYKLLAFGLSSLYAGIAGALLGHSVEPSTTSSSNSTCRSSTWP